MKYISKIQRRQAINFAPFIFEFNKNMFRFKELVVKNDDKTQTQMK